MKFNSTKTFLHIVFSILFFIWIIILILITINHSYSCVDRNGCIRSYCQYKRLYNEYQNLIDSSNCKRKGK